MNEQNYGKMLTFTDAFIFGMVVRNPEICTGLLKVILPDESFYEIKIHASDNPLLSEEPLDVDNLDIEKLYIEIEKSLRFDKGMHGVRFDAYAETPDKCATIEMQTYMEANIGKRCRFYQCNIDLDHLEKGMAYEKLKRSFIIMICTYDPFELDEPVYFFENIDKQKGLSLKDDCFKIILNTSCTPEKVPDGLKPLYEYINDPSKSEGSTLIKAIDSRVRKFNTPEWRRRQMTLEYMMKREYDKGVEEGIEKGIEQEKLNMAQIMKRNNEAIEKICEYTGLTKEIIEKL